MNYFIHNSSDVKTNKIGIGTKIWQFNVVLENAEIGENCNINSHCFIENNVIIGNNVTVKCGVYIWDETVIEDDVFIGPNVTFTNDKYPRSKKYPEGNFERLVIKRGASIGAGSTILTRLTIGEYAMIGVGSIITKDVPPFTLWYGTPAKHMGYVTKEGIVLNLQMISKEGIQYKMLDNNFIKI